MKESEVSLESVLLRNKSLCASKREKSIYIHADYYGTISPDFLFNEQQGGMTTVHGNSFGPFCPEEYFSRPREKRMLFILRESYIPKKSFSAGDRGGHNQACIYNKAISYDGWNGIQNKTFENIARIAYSISYGEAFDNSIDSKTKACEVLNNQVAVININDFPCICSLKSNKTFISKWAEKNEDSLKELIEFYNAGLIYCGGVAYDLYRHQHDREGRFGPYETKVMPFHEICDIVGYPLFNKRDFFYSSEHLIINGYHPQCYSINNTSGLIPIIRHWEKI